MSGVISIKLPIYPSRLFEMKDYCSAHEAQTLNDLRPFSKSGERCQVSMSTNHTALPTPKQSIDVSMVEAGEFPSSLSL